VGIGIEIIKLLQIGKGREEEEKEEG